MFPDWLKQLFPRSPTDTHTHGAFSWLTMDDGSVTVSPTARKKQGQASTKKVRVVCVECNNQWLSKLEERTKPLLSTLVPGQPVNIGPAEQLLLATWAVKTVMTAEFIEPNEIAIPQDHRTLLRKTLTPPPSGWWVWIAGYRGIKWITGLYHFAARLNVPPIDPETAHIKNIQSTTIGLGRLLIHAISTTVPGYSFALDKPNVSDLKPVWPINTAVTTWPPTRLVDDNDVDFIKSNLERAFGVPTTTAI